MAAAIGAVSAAERSYPTSKLRGRSWEDPMPEGGRPRELPHVRGQGQQPRVPGCDGTEKAEKSYPSPRSGAAPGRSYPKNEVRGGGQDDLPHSRGQGQRTGGATLRLRPGVVVGKTNPTSKKQWLRGCRRA